MTELPDDIMALFVNQGLAVQWWFDEVKEWGKEVAAGGHMEDLHLYWRLKPAFHSTTYLAMDQGGLMRTQSPLARILQIDLGFVTSEFLISKLGPDGKEG